MCKCILRLGVKIGIHIVLKILICELSKLNSFKNTQCQTSYMLWSWWALILETIHEGLRRHMRAWKSWMNNWDRPLTEDTTLSLTPLGTGALLRHNLCTGNLMNLKCILWWSLTNIFRDVLVSWFSGGKGWLATFVDFHGVSTPTTADFKLVVV